MRKFISDFLKEKYFYLKHSSGLSIYIYPKRNYKSYHAVMSTKYGSVNQKFKLNSEIIETPAGIAHFLEHKLFECQDRDAFEMFSKTGASANACTSWNKTEYYFSCSDNFKESLKILLDFVQEPYFTESGVNKERGIIEQEIKMYSDSPGWQSNINLLNSLYWNHPVKEDIAGSVESISRIDSGLLNKCYESFYNLSNMTLCLVGDFNPNDMLEFVDKNIKKPHKDNKVESIFPDEPEEVKSHFVSGKMEVVNSYFDLGFKHKVSGKNITCREFIISDIVLRIIMMKSGKIYNDLLDKHLITTNSFEYELFDGPYYKSSIFSGESENPEKVAEIIRYGMMQYKNNGVNNEEFNIAKKCCYSDTISLFDRVSSIADNIIDMDFSGYKIFELVDMISNISINEINEQIAKDFNENNWALSVINKNK